MHFNRERTCRLRVEEAEGTLSNAVPEDIVRAVLACAPSVRERVARAIWPDIFERLERAEAVFEAVDDSRLGLKRLDAYREKYPRADEEIPF